MRFRTFGNLEAPDWILKEVAILSKISAVRLKLLSTQVIVQLVTGDINYEKVAKCTKDAELGASDIKAAVAALRYILSSAAKYDVADGTLKPTRGSERMHFGDMISNADMYTHTLMYAHASRSLPS